MGKKRTFAYVIVLLTMELAASGSTDPYLWLEEVEGQEALDWARERNQASQAAIEAFPGFEKIHSETLAILQSDERIPYVRRRGEWLYNFWQDKDHNRGFGAGQLGTNTRRTSQIGKLSWTLMTLPKRRGRTGCTREWMSWNRIWTGRSCGFRRAGKMRRFAGVFHTGQSVRGGWFRTPRGQE